MGDADEHAMAEIFFAALECELVGHRRFATRAKARLALLAGIEGAYDPRRRHASEESGVSAPVPAGREKDTLGATGAREVPESA